MAKLKSPAKVNLGLSIVGRRRDEYHQLQSLFWPIHLYDDLTVFSSTTSSVEAKWAVDNSSVLHINSLPQDGANLVGKALLALSPSSESYRVGISKRIPMGGGLGGGSSNAGTFLKYWSERSEERQKLAATLAPKLGADVPFFLDPRPSWVTGVGEQITPLQVSEDILHDIRFLILLPSFSSDTREAFSEFKASQSAFSAGSLMDPSLPLDWPNLREYLGRATNSLEPTVVQRFPVIGKLLSALRETSCLYAGLSGSGSSCVAVYASADDCDNSAKVLEELCRSYDCRSLKTETFLGG